MPDRRVRFRVQYQGKEYTLQDPTTGNEVFTMDHLDDPAEQIRIAHMQLDRVGAPRTKPNGERLSVAGRIMYWSLGRVMCGHCRDCRWWGQEWYDAALAAGTIRDTGTRECQEPMVRDMCMGDEPAEMPDHFGCVQHQLREEAR